MDSRVSAMWTRFREHRLASIFFILATLAVGILIGTVVSSSVSGQESKKSVPSDATPLTIPAPQQLSNEFSKIVANFEPSVVNINTDRPSKLRGAVVDRRTIRSGRQSFDDFFDRFFGGQVAATTVEEMCTSVPGIRRDCRC